MLVTLGMPIAWDAGKKLKDTHLIIVAVEDLLGAILFIFVIFSPSQDSILGWLFIASLNNVLPYVALLAGHKRSNLSK